MNVKRYLPLALAAVLSLQHGCGGGGTKDEGGAYRRLAAEAVRLYVEIHPLRSSRLGLAGADSLLFVYGEDEIAAAVKGLARLDRRLSELSATGLSERDVDQARVIIHWARGERFALETLAIQRTSPLLYVCAAEEALGEMPSRFGPARPGEAEAYRKRVLATAELCSNAARALSNPAEAHARFAVTRLDDLDSRIGDIGRLAKTRYGTSFDRELESARGALALFRNHLAGPLLAGARGGLILGAENLSMVFLHDEFLDADPNMLVAEAERRITRIAADRASAAKRLEAGKGRADSGGGPPHARYFRMPDMEASESPGTFAARAIDTLWTSGGRGVSFGVSRSPEPSIHAPADTRFAATAPKDPYFSLPIIAPPEVIAGTAPLGSGACRPFVLLSGDAPRLDAGALRYALLAAAPALLEASRLVCESRDTVSAVFASETWREGLAHLALADIAENLRKNDPELYLRLLDDWTLRLARTVVVLRIHAGTLTTERAAGYFVETAHLEREDAEREALASAVSPSIAWPGISMILVERMVDRLTDPDVTGRPRQKARALLARERNLPLPIVERKI